LHIALPLILTSKGFKPYSLLARITDEKGIYKGLNEKTVRHQRRQANC